MSGRPRLLLCALLLVLGISSSPSQIEVVQIPASSPSKVEDERERMPDDFVVKRAAALAPAEGVHQLVHHVHASTSGTAVTKLQDVPVGKVIQVGFVKFVKAADDAYIATDKVECPDNSWFAGKYVKCWDSESQYTQTCTGSYYCDSNTSSWNSSSNKCVGKITCGANSSPKSGTTDTCTCNSGYYADGSGSTEHHVEGGSCSYTACASGTYADGVGRAFKTGSETCSYKKCSGTNVAATYIPSDQFCTCKTGYYYISGGDYKNLNNSYVTDSGSCTIHLDANKKYMTDGTNFYWISSKGVLYNNSAVACDGTPIGGFCWDQISSNMMTWANRKCTTTSGYSIPTVEQIQQMLTNFGCSGELIRFCNALTGILWGGATESSYWSSSEASATTAYFLYFYPSFSYTGNGFTKTSVRYTRCIKD